MTAQHTKEERKKTDVVQDRPCTSFSPLCKTDLKYSTDFSWHILRYFVICNGNANISPNTGQENNRAQPKQISYFASHLIFHRFSPFNCCLNVV